MVKEQHRLTSKQEERRRRKRIKGAGWLLSAAVLVLLLRLWQLQVWQGGHYEDLARSRFVRAVSLAAPRGIIYDRNLKPLATSTVSYTIAIAPAEFEELPHRLRLLSTLLEMMPHEIKTCLAKNNRRPFEPVPVKENVDTHTLARVCEHLIYLPGVLIQEQPLRSYPLGTFACHILGHVGQVSENELKRRRDVDAGDVVGKLGVERRYDAAMQGQKGKELLEVDATGMPVQRLGFKKLKRGESLVLTLDSEVQWAAEKALEGKVGAAVVMDVRSGEVLALASNPKFDPNFFSGKLDKKAWRSIALHPHKPLLNRAISSALPPGSTFKVITAAAGLANGVIEPKTRFYCPGAMTGGRRTFRCWRRHGSVNLYQAIGQSCDVYFYNVGKRVGAQRLEAMAKQFGLGKRTGIDLPGEAVGIIPSPLWKLRCLGEPWFGGDTVNMSIGQGYVCTTPIQMCLVAATIANGGTLLQPRIARCVLYADGKVKQRFKKSIIGQVMMPTEHIAVIREGMRLTVYGGGGTAGRMRGLPFTVAGKTGSAQHRRGKRPHAWFIGFAPVDSPRIAWCVMVESSGHGGEVAVPIARKILEAAQRYL